ncbi:MAG: non-homologous end-joining DNA ligase [Acidobacteriota bacterium]|nr:MAG: non-homologous end-joining DNA ligase [Acidobacteriota bacterium]
MTDWLNKKIAPMLAKTGSPFDSDRHLFEIKWDGIRVLAFFGDGVARLQGRKLTDATARYPEVVAALERLPGEGILDGEVIVIDDDGRPNFQRVLIREQTASHDAALLQARPHPVVYVAFDLLYKNGEPLFDRPLAERRRLLSDLLKEPPSPIVESTYVLSQGKALFKEADERGLEGVMAKVLESRYVCGERSNAWLKLKVRRRTDGVLVGIVREHRAHRVKSLVLGVYENDGLVWLGNVGSGLDQNTIAELGTELGPLKSERPPDFAADAPGEIDWLKPALVVRVEYSELTMDHRLRHPVFIGFVKKDPRECRIPLR